MLKEHPILFSAPMVRALLEGTKTQTRRPVKWRGLESGLNLQFSGLSVERSGSNWVLTSPTRTSHEYRSVPMPCPYGQPSDRLWVRETWAYHLHAQGSLADDDGPWVYAADGEQARQYRLCSRWRPSIHMPRCASRITLEIMAVRVERLQDISEADAMAEGISEFIGGWWCEHEDGPQQAGRSPQEGYRHLWERINGPGSWDANPFVWCVSFRRVATC